MKNIFIPIIFILFYNPLIAQEVENIRVENEGDIINIYYDLIDANPNAKYNIKILCSINNNPRFIIQNASGDVGSNVSVRKNNKAVWDLKGESNYNELIKNQSFEFFVRAERLNTYDFPDKTSDNKFIIAYNGSTVDFLGFKVGIVKNWGGYFSLRKFDSYSLSVGLIKSIPKSFFYLYAGTGIGNWAWLSDPADDAIEYWDSHSASEANIGLMFIYSKLYLEVGTSVLISDRGTFPDLTFGIGIAF